MPRKIDLWIDLEHNLKHNNIIKLFATLPNQIRSNLFDDNSYKKTSKFNFKYKSVTTV